MGETPVARLRRQEKLIRDKDFRDRPDLVRTAGRHELAGLLADKIGEEASELATAMRSETTRDRRDWVLDEIADVQQVLVAVRRLLGFSASDVNRRMRDKRLGRGGFSDRVLVDVSAARRSSRGRRGSS